MERRRKKKKSVKELKPEYSMYCTMRLLTPASLLLLEILIDVAVVGLVHGAAAAGKHQSRRRLLVSSRILFPSFPLYLPCEPI